MKISKIDFGVDSQETRSLFIFNPKVEKGNMLQKAYKKLFYAMKHRQSYKWDIKPRGQANRK